MELAKVLSRQKGSDVYAEKELVRPSDCVAYESFGRLSFCFAKGDDSFRQVLLA